MPKRKQNQSYVLCIKNDGSPASLEVRKIYQAVTDTDAAARGFIRIVDESGEDYLFPEAYFVPIDLPGAAAMVFGRAS